MEPKQETVRKPQSQTWSTDDDNLAEGIKFINKNAPECDAQNEQTYWVLTRPPSNLTLGHPLRDGPR